MRMTKLSTDFIEVSFKINARVLVARGDTRIQRRQAGTKESIIGFNHFLRSKCRRSRRGFEFVDGRSKDFCVGYGSVEKQTRA